MVAAGANSVVWSKSKDSFPYLEVGCWLVGLGGAVRKAA